MFSCLSSKSVLIVALAAGLLTQVFPCCAFVIRSFSKVSATPEKGLQKRQTERKAYRKDRKKGLQKRQKERKAGRIRKKESDKSDQKISEKQKVYPKERKDKGKIKQGRKDAAAADNENENSQSRTSHGPVS